VRQAHPGGHQDDRQNGRRSGRHWPPVLLRLLVRAE
jgi:hypothetical protein